MVGSFGKTLDKIFLEAADAPHADFIRHENTKFSGDLHQFIKILHPENLFKEIPDRFFNAFSNFSYDVN
jgi:hypothetical protein